MIPQLQVGHKQLRLGPKSSLLFVSPGCHLWSCRNHRPQVKVAAVSMIARDRADGSGDPPVLLEGLEGSRPALAGALTLRRDHTGDVWALEFARSDVRQVVVDTVNICTSQMFKGTF